MLLVMIMMTMLEVFEIVLMRISLTLKTYGEVSLDIVLVLDKKNEPFYDVPKIESHIKQLPLLGSVYSLVV